MANLSNVKMPIGRFFKPSQLTVNLTLTGVRPLLIRLKLGVLLIRLAKIVGGFKVEILGQLGE